MTLRRTRVAVIALAALVVFCLARSGRSCWKTLPWHGRAASGPGLEQLAHYERARPYLGGHGYAGYLSDLDFGGPYPGMNAYAAQYALLPILLGTPVTGEPAVATLHEPASLERAIAAGYEVVADLGDGLWVLRKAP